MASRTSSLDARAIRSIAAGLVNRCLINCSKPCPMRTFSFPAIQRRGLNHADFGMAKIAIPYPDIRQLRLVNSSIFSPPAIDDNTRRTAYVEESGMRLSGSAAVLERWIELGRSGMWLARIDGYFAVAQ